MILGGIDWVALQKAMRRWVADGSGLDHDTQVVYGQQEAPRPPAPAIILRVSNIAENGKPWSTMEENPLVLGTKTVTAVNATANTLAIPAHGMVTADGPLDLGTTGTEPGGTDVDDPYWAVVVDANTVKLAASFANAIAASPVTVDLLDGGTGTHTLSSNDDTRRAGAEIMQVIRGTVRVTLELKCHSVKGLGLDMATAILQRVRTRRVLESQKAILRDVKAGISDVDRVRALLGIRDAALFEPKALLEVHINVPLEDGAALTYIDIVEITNLLTGRVTSVTR